MKIHEYQAKEILAKYGVALPKGRVVTDPVEAANFARELGGKVVVKAQVHVGGRGKAGGVKLAADAHEANAVASQILGMDIKGYKVEKVLVEEALDIKEEYYLGLINDRASQQNMLMISKMGGVDIEQVADENPEAIVKQGIDAGFGISDFEVREACYAAGLNKDSVAGAAGFVKALYQAFVANDCTLAEINPLVLTSAGRLIAADAKMNIDDNALFRHPDLALMAEVGSDLHPLEKVAHERKIAYVHLDGDIGIIGNGAGLVMGTMDEVKRAGGNPANFLDVGGGAQAESVRDSVELVLMDKNVKGLLFNIFGGITRCDEVATGLKDALATLKIDVPIVVRLTGTREEEGRAILETIPGLHPAPTMQEAAKKIVELAYS